MIIHYLCCPIKTNQKQYKMNAVIFFDGLRLIGIGIVVLIMGVLAIVSLFTKDKFK